MRYNSQMPHQQRADAPSLIRVDHHEGDLRLSGLHDDVTSSAGDDRSALFIDFRDERDVFVEIDVDEKIDFFFGKATFRSKKAPLKRLCTGSLDGGEHAGSIIRAKSADPDPPAVAERFDPGIGGGSGHKEITRSVLPKWRIDSCCKRVAREMGVSVLTFDLDQASACAVQQ